MNRPRVIPARLKEQADIYQQKYGYNLTAKQAAKFLGTTSGTLAVWRHEGRKPDYIKLGRAVRYPLDSLIEFQENSKVTTT